MKIERVSDNQIKFILTESDLSERNMRLHELSYGSEKAQELFREIMERATTECDFHTTSETPLIIEAIPVSRDGIMIIVTKVASQEDLEDRLGYPPVVGSLKNGGSGPKKKKPERPDADNAMRPPGSRPFMRPPNREAKTPPEQIIFEFASLDTATSACGRLYGNFAGGSSLYKFSGKYYLVIENSRFMLSESQEGYAKEYGSRLANSDISKTFLVEHGEAIVASNAVGILSAYLG